MELDLLGLVESRKQAFQSAQRSKRGACSGRPSSSSFEVRGSLHRFQACLVLNLSTLLVSDSFSPSPSAPAQRSWQAPGRPKSPKRWVEYADKGVESCRHSTALYRTLPHSTLHLTVTGRVALYRVENLYSLPGRVALYRVESREATPQPRAGGCAAPRCHPVCRAALRRATTPRLSHAPRRELPCPAVMSCAAPQRRAPRYLAPGREATRLAAIPRRAVTPCAAPRCCAPRDDAAAVRRAFLCNAPCRRAPFCRLHARKLPTKTVWRVHGVPSAPSAACGVARCPL